MIRNGSRSCGGRDDLEAVPAPGVLWNEGEIQMPLYLAETSPSGNEGERGLAPLLLSAPNFRILPWDGSQFGRGTWDALLQDFFEITNPGFMDMPYILLPNGCPTLVFVLRSDRPGCYLCGPLTKARRVHVPADGILFCVRFKVGSMHWFGTKAPAVSADRAAPLHRCFLNADVLLGQLCSAGSFQERCEVVLQDLEQRGAKGYCADPLIQTCMEAIHKKRGTGRVGELAGVISRSERFLSRSFRAATGLSVKTYCEIVKFQNSFYSILMSHPRNLTDVVKAYGYYDLPHMNRAYRKFLNYTASDIRYLSLEELYAPDLLAEG